MHSPAGDLLVVYSNSRLCYRDSALDRQTSAMLGFEAPTFTCGTDLMLPVGANADLREVSASDTKTKVDGTDDVAATALAKLVEINNVSEFLRSGVYSTIACAATDWRQACCFLAKQQCLQKLVCAFVAWR